MVGEERLGRGAAEAVHGGVVPAGALGGLGELAKEADHVGREPRQEGETRDGACQIRLIPLSPVTYNRATAAVISVTASSRLGVPTSGLALHSPLWEALGDCWLDPALGGVRSARTLPAPSRLWPRAAASLCAGLTRKQQ